MTKIMFVCHGNICRSPMAEFVMKKLVKDAKLENEFYITSSATSTEEIWQGVGNPIYPPARREMEKHNIPFDISKRAMSNISGLLNVRQTNPVDLAKGT